MPRTLFIPLIILFLAACEERSQSPDPGTTDASTTDAQNKPPEGNEPRAANEPPEGNEPRTSNAPLKDARKLWDTGRRLAAIELLGANADGDAELLNELGYMSFKVDNLVDAAKHLEAAKAATTDQTPVELRARIAYNTALVAEARGDTPTAKDAITRAYELDPGESVAEALVRIKGVPPLDCSVFPHVVELVEKEVEDQSGLAWKGDSEVPPGFTIWTGDLNGDDIEDRVLNHRACGNWGDCVFVVYAGCPDGSYAVVYQEYAQSAEVTDSITVVDGRPWSVIELGDREARATDNEKVSTNRKEFNGKSY